MHTHTNIQTYTHTLTHIHTEILTYTHKHTHTHSYMNMHTHIHTHRHWHTHTYTYRQGNVLFNDALNTFYIIFYSVRHMVKINLDSEKGNPLLPHGLFFWISSNGSFICTIS